MRHKLGAIGRVLLGVLIALLLVPTVVSPFLDRIYYRGPVTPHFDGARFFNPEGEEVATGRPRRSPIAMMARFALGDGRATWPAHVAVAKGYPPAAATACLIRPRHMIENWARCVAEPDRRRMFVTWIGHSTVLIQAGGVSILTDPVWADRVGPFGLVGPRRVRDPGIAIDDLPKIDLILVSHDHYDHMDVATLARLWARDRPLIVTSLGNDTILRARGIPALARDWGESVRLRPGVQVFVERVHHWGSRWGSDRNRALWSGFSVTLPGGNLFFAGDTGLGDGRWPIEAARHGPFRLAILPIGAIEPRAMMRPSHIDPADAVDVFRTLNPGHALAVHWGTFQLSNEPIDAPRLLLARSLAAAKIAPGRFRAIEVGQPWEIPEIRR